MIAMSMAGPEAGREQERFSARPTRNTFGFELRQDRIDPVGLYSTLRRDRLSTTREDDVVEGSTGIYAQNDSQWAEWFRSILGIRYDWYRFNVDASIRGEFGQRDLRDRVTQGRARLRAMEPDRVFRERRLGLSQQRCARCDDQGRSEVRRSRRSGDAARAQHGRRARCTHWSDPRRCSPPSRCGTSSSTASWCSWETRAPPRPAGRRAATAWNGTRAGARSHGCSSISTSPGITRVSPATRRKATTFPARPTP